MRFTEYMNHNTLPYMVLAFTEVSAVERYLQSQTLHLIVTSEPDIFNSLDIPIIFLSGIRQEGTNVLYRYQNADALTEEITMYFSGLYTVVDMQGAEIIMVYSPLGRCGKTALALELVRQIPGSLYLGMECFSSLDMEAGSLEGLLYSIMQKDASILEELPHLQGALYSGYMLKSPDCYYDLRSLDYEHLEWFLAQLKTCKMYTSIVLDVGGTVFDNPKMLNLCDRLLVPTVQGERESQVIAGMERGFQKNGCKDILTKMEFLALPDQYQEPYRFEDFVRKLLC